MADKSEAIKEDIIELWKEYTLNRKSEYKEKIVEYYLPLVKIVAGRTAIGMPHYVEKDDLISNGFFGLLDAIDRYDYTRGIKFETYAVTRIRGAILDAIRAQDWVPTTLRQKARQYEKTVASLENQLGRSATDEEISVALGLSLEELNNLLNQLNVTTLMPLEEFAKTETPSSQIPNPSQYIEDDEVKQTLAKAIDKLAEKERMVIALYYYEGMTLKEISLILNLSEARISQLHTKAVFRLRGALSRIKSSLL